MKSEVLLRWDSQRWFLFFRFVLFLNREHLVLAPQRGKNHIPDISLCCVSTHRGILG